MKKPGISSCQFDSKWWHKIEGKEQIQCDLCPRNCVLKDGVRGFCFVRQNVGGQMQLTTYGSSTGFCIDPIEKKPLNHFFPGTSVLSFGTAGCNMGCQFCQNWSISKSREIESLSDNASPAEIAEAARKLQCKSVAFTYNDPVIWAEYAIDTANECRKRGIKAVAVTAGYINAEARPELFGAMDAVNVDLKGFTEQFYQRLTLANLEPVLDTLKFLKNETDKWLEITNLVIPEENSAIDEVGEMCNWIVENLGPDVPLHFTAFHPDYKLKHRPRTSEAILFRARKQAIDAGINYVYVGNVLSSKFDATYCPGCSECLIERKGYNIVTYRLKDNTCSTCGTVIPGVFGKFEGSWGNRRVPVRLRGLRA